MSDYTSFVGHKCFIRTTTSAFVGDVVNAVHGEIRLTNAETAGRDGTLEIVDEAVINTAAVLSIHVAGEAAGDVSKFFLYGE